MIIEIRSFGHCLLYWYGGKTLTCVLVITVIFHQHKSSNVSEEGRKWKVERLENEGRHEERVRGGGMTRRGEDNRQQPGRTMGSSFLELITTTDGRPILTDGRE